MCKWPDELFSAQEYHAEGYPSEMVGFRRPSHCGWPGRAGWWSRKRSRNRHHRVLSRDPAQVSMQSIPHLFPDCRLSSAGAEDQVNQTRCVTMRQENQPSLMGLVFLARCTQHWFGAGPSFSSCATCMRRTVLGYYQVVPIRQAQGRLCGTLRCKQRSRLRGNHVRVTLL